MKTPYSWHSANLCCSGTEVLKYVLERIQKNPSGSLPNLKNMQMQYYLKIKCSLLEYLHNITLRKLLPFHDLHTVGFGSHWLLHGIVCQAIMTDYAGFCFIHLSIFQLPCLSLLLYFSVQYSWPFFPCQMLNTSWYCFRKDHWGWRTGSFGQPCYFHADPPHPMQPAQCHIVNSFPTFQCCLTLWPLTLWNWNFVVQICTKSGKELPAVKEQRWELWLPG